MIILDLETTGLNPETSDIIEFAAVKINEDYEVMAELSFLCKPLKTQISPQVSYLTHIQAEDLSDKLSFAEHHAEVRAFLAEEKIIIGHNIAFDLGFLAFNEVKVPDLGLDTQDLAMLFLEPQDSYA